MDFQAITQVNKRWIFSAGDQRDKATPELLREIYADATSKAVFYANMHSELAAIIDRENEALHQRHCPTVDEIEKTPFRDRFEKQRQRDYYIRDCNRISGMYDVLSEAWKKYSRADKIARQARAALEG